MQCCARDEGGPLEIALQGEVSNHLKLRWSNAMVVSVEEKVLLDRIRCVTRRRIPVNRRQLVESVGMSSKPGGSRYPGISLEETCSLSRRRPAWRRRELVMGLCVERWNLCPDAKGEIQVEDPRESEYQCRTQGRTGT